MQYAKIYNCEVRMMKQVEIKREEINEIAQQKSDEIFADFIMQIESLNPLAEWIDKNGITENLHHRVKISNKPKNWAN